MAIRPLDMQVMIPKLQEIAHMKHLEQQKAGVNQQEIGASLGKKNEKFQKTVAKTSEDEALDHHSDAKEKGKNQYYSAQKKDNLKNKENEDTVPGLPKHKIDIKI